MHRVFIIDPADEMGRAAANALLKTLEEPIEGTLIVLLSARADRLPVTIRSRCQMLKFPLPAEQQALAWIERNTQIEPGQAAQLLQLASGAPLLAPGLVERGELVRHNQLLEDFQSIAANQVSAVQISEAWLKEYELSRLLAYMANWLVALIRWKMVPQVEDGLPLLQSLSEQLDLKLLYQLYDKLHETERMTRNNLNSQLALESILLDWSRIANGED